MRCLEVLIAALLVALLGGCGTVGSVASVVASSVANTFTGEPQPAYLDWNGLMIAADPDANANSAIALDVVFVRDNQTLEKLQVIPATRWFATRQELQRTFPEALIVHSLELVPSQTLRLTEAELGSPRVAGVLLFANYFSPGEHRLRLPVLKNGVLIRLGPAEFTATAHPL